VKTLEMLMSEIYVLPILNKYTDLIDLNSYLFWNNCIQVTLA